MPIMAAGVAVVGTGGVLGTRPGVVGAPVWGATSAAAAALTAATHVDQRAVASGGFGLAT